MNKKKGENKLKKKKKSKSEHVLKTSDYNTICSGDIRQEVQTGPKSICRSNKLYGTCEVDFGTLWSIEY